MKKVLQSAVPYARYVGVAGSMLVGQANAKVSDITGNLATESGLIMGQVLFVIACIGALIFGISVLSAIGAKKNNRPLEWQMWGMVGGACALIIPLLIGAVTGSLTGEEAELNTRYSGSGF